MASPKITLEQVRHVADLAALELDQLEAERTCQQLGQILDAMTALEQVDVSDVEPTFHPVALGSALRPDEVRASPPRTELLAAAPASEEGAFAVPRVLEGD